VSNAPGFELYWPKTKKLSRPAKIIGAVVILSAIVVAVSLIPKTHDHTVVSVQRKVIATGSTIPTGTTVSPSNGATAQPILNSPSTLKTSIVITCPSATSIKIYSVSNGQNTLTVSPPGAKTVIDTAGTPVITTYSPTHGTWNVSDITTGSTDGIEWTSNGSSCVQG